MKDSKEERNDSKMLANGKGREDQGWKARSGAYRYHQLSSLLTHVVLSVLEGMNQEHSCLGMAGDARAASAISLA